MTDDPRVRLNARAIRIEGIAVTDCSEHYRAAHNSIGSAHLNSDDLGILGRGLIDQFNQAFDNVADKIKKAEDAVASAGTGLGNVATAFGDMDDESAGELERLTQEAGHST
ncbi:MULTISPECIES: hypothetical protein [unclassified Nocardia]|uniref:hypothetical protein n=1 Tax=unclassified Nocardia TaxID=2637762 RepID=UPI001CE49A98|nr:MULTISPECIES: hypothetical protein [unclassified Nocardia]